MQSSNFAVAPAPSGGLRNLALRQSAPLGLMLVLGWILFSQGRTLDVGAVRFAVADIRPWQWSLACLATLGSLLAFGRFESIIHRLMGTGAEERDARRAGIAAVAAAQLAGFGPIVGTLARWRMFPDMAMIQAMRLTAAVSVAFMLCLGLMAAAALMLTPLLPEPWRLLCGAVLLGLLGTSVASVWRPRRALRWPVPPLRAQGALLVWAAADAILAATALYVLLPPDALPPLPLFMAVFLIALGAGLLGATPGGVGPFEFLAITCLPAVPQADLIAAILGFRLVYYALPALAALAILVAGPAQRRRAAPGPRLRFAMAPLTSPIKAEAPSFNAGRADST